MVGKYDKSVLADISAKNEKCNLIITSDRYDFADRLNKELNRF